MNVPAAPESIGLVAKALLARAVDPAGWESFEHAAKQVGYCTNPIHLAAHSEKADPATGELRQVDDTQAGLMLPCRNRRAGVCPTCSRVYGADTFHLTRAGIEGGKTVPTSVAEHPRLFITLTAPSFGAVHTATTPERPACALGPASACRHGHARACALQHQPDDACIGAALCVECFDYVGLVMFNAHAAALWSRTLIDIPRTLAAATGNTVKATNLAVRLAHTKAAEYQSRGAIHFHGLLRLDAREDGVLPPPEPFTDPGLFITAVMTSIRRVQLPIPGRETRVGWGHQSDIALIDADDEGDTGGGVSGSRVAGYLAKYCTKALPHNLTSTDEGEHAPGTRAEHWAKIARTCRDLARDPDLSHLNLKQRAVNLGYSSTPVTRSRTYSTTLGALRAERQQHAQAKAAARDRQAHHADAGSRAPDDPTAVETWAYAGRGWANPGEAIWAANRAEQHLAAYTHARDQRHEERASP